MLRQGFTTGSAAAAASSAALGLLLTGQAPSGVQIPLVDSGHWCILLDDCRLVGEAARCFVVKDGGDDPDATHGARIGAEVRFSSGEGGRHVRIRGGRGVGRVTLPGLPTPVGEAAINPGPLEQIRKALIEVMERHAACGAVDVVVEVEDGEAIAQRTMNARLGIRGGISILGTTGVVRPLSHDAWRACVDQAMDVARALGLDDIHLSTGRRSERLFLERRPGFPEQGSVQAGDHFAHSLRAAARRGFATIWWSVLFGKLVKQAMGLASTHARDGRLDLDWLAGVGMDVGMAPDVCRQVRGANTARGALESLRGAQGFEAMLDRLGTLWSRSARAFAGPGPGLGLTVFDPHGEFLFERCWPAQADSGSLD